MPTPPKRRWSAIERIYWIAGGLAKEGGIAFARPVVPAHRATPS